MDTLTPESLMLAPSLSSSEPESIDDAAPPPLTESFTVSRPPDEVHSTGAEDTISVGELTSVLDSKLGRLRLLAPIKVPGGWVKWDSDRCRRKMDCVKEVDRRRSPRSGTCALLSSPRCRSALGVRVVDDLCKVVMSGVKVCRIQLAVGCDNYGTLSG